MVASMIPSFYLGMGSWLGSGNQPLPWIHIQDLCSLIKFSIENKAVTGPLNGVAPQIITNKQFSKAGGGNGHSLQPN